MTTRTVALIHWALSGVILLWIVAAFLLTQIAVSFTLGVVISSFFIAIGLIVSLSINGAIFFRDRPLGRAEAIFLGIEGLLILLMVVAGVADQLEFDSIQFTSVGSSLGHWLDWFMPLWLLIGPVALTVLILAAINRGKLPPKVSAPAS